MKNLEKRAVYFFDRLALLISEDPEVRDVLRYYRRFTDMFLSDQYKVVWKRGNDFFERPGAEYLGSQLLFYIGKFMKYGRLDSAIGPDEAPWPAWKPELQQEMFFDGDR